jgi:NAD(P)-dependent dehydrogenase (short-subunit alcohol dehydrogenase family)
LPLASRDPDKLRKLVEETAGATFACEATEPEEVAALFEVVIATQGAPDIVVYNASARARGPVTDLIPRKSHVRSLSARTAVSWWCSMRRGT